MEQIGPGDRLQATPSRVQGGDPSNDPDGNNEIDVEDGREGQPAGVQHGGDGHRDIDDHGVESHDRSRPGVVAVLEILGHGVDAGFQETRQQRESDDHDAHGTGQLPGADCQADVTSSLAGHAHKLFRRQVRRHDREANERPCQAPARKEVIFAALLAPALVHAEGDDEGKEAQKDNDIEDAQSHAVVSRLMRWLVARTTLFRMESKDR